MSRRSATAIIERRRTRHERSWRQRRSRQRFARRWRNSRHMPPPRISVLIPTYNRATLLRACLNSVLAQTLRPAQVLVIDDGSTDETPRLLAELRSDVESIRVPQGGKSSAVN